VRDVQTVWARSHVLLLPSRADNAPLALVEAMLAGRPAVATDVGGIAEWIEDGETGWLAAPNPHALAEALERMWIRRDHLVHHGQRARDRARELIDSSAAETFLDMCLGPVQNRA
jgi:glycosyltransferase involved in cell wall biosynthesis